MVQAHGNDIKKMQKRNLETAIWKSQPSDLAAWE